MLCFERPSMGGGVPESRQGQEAAITIWWWLLHIAVMSPTPSSTHPSRGMWVAFLLHGLSEKEFGRLRTTLFFLPHLPSFPQTFDQATNYKEEDKSSVLPYHFCLQSNTWRFGYKE